MTLTDYQALSDEQQLALVYETATFLATRWDGAEAVNLYHLPDDVFVELFYDPAANEITRLRSFVSADPLGNPAIYLRGL